MRTFTEEFIQQCRGQDRQAQKRLFDALFAPLLRTANRYVSDVSEAEDCVMKGFLKAFLNLDKFKFKDESSFYFWIRRIVINETLMFLRQRHNFILNLEEDYEDQTTENDALQKLAAEELNQLITSLPQGYRTVFCLYVVDGYDHAEIATQLGISESTSRTQLAKARQRLKLLLEKQIDESARWGG